MRVVLHMITSADGFIARSDGKSISTKPDWDEFVRWSSEYDNFVVGRKTFELVGEDGFVDAPCRHKVVVSSRKDICHDSSFHAVGSPEEAVSYLQSQGLDTLFLVGGSELSTAFAKAGLITEVVLIVQPVLVGNGIRLFSEIQPITLSLEGAKKLVGGRIRISYQVKN